MRKIAVAGCYLEWDLFGHERSFYNSKIDMPSDAKRIADISWIGSEGYWDKIVVAQDICSKDRLIKYGGHGYGYLPSQIVPRMRARGYSDKNVDKVMEHNPAMALTFVEPKTG